MTLTALDLAIIAAVLLVVVGVGVWTSWRAGKNPEQFFLSGRGMSGWLLGLSMVATTFAADTPGLVTQLVRENGVAGNWAWWAFLLTGMLTVFLFARLWRRSGVTTDLEFYELRYSGAPAVVLRVFRALYLGVVFNVIIMAVVSVAAIKIGQVMLGVDPLTILICGGVASLALSAMGGFRAVVLTDCLLFGVAMAGAIAAAYFAVQHPSVGGMQALLANEAVIAKQGLFPSSDASLDLWASVLLVPLLVQWWSVWYPGAEPGGGGYLAQRMLAAKNESHAVGAVMFFNCAHYALRPWPWILVALASIVVYPDLDALREQYPNVAEDKIGHDLAYPAMLTQAPAGWRGVIVASLLAAYVSTISTHLNWGASYVTNDVYARVIDRSGNARRQVLVGRVATVVMMLLASGLAWQLRDAKQGFDLLLSVGAGTGLIYILRWYWWRVNAYAEIVAMAASVGVAAFFQLGPDLKLAGWQKLSLGVLATTAIWLPVVFATSEPMEKLIAFCRAIRPAGPGWRKVYDAAAEQGEPIDPPNADEGIGLGLQRMALGCVAIYSALFAVGLGLYGDTAWCVALSTASVVAGGALAASLRRRPPEAT